MTGDEGPSAHPETNEPDPVTRRRRWPIGTLTLVAVAAVVVGGILLGTRSGASDTTLPFTVEDVPSAASVPALPVPGVAVPDGEVAPDFTVTLFDGTLFSLSAHLRDDGRPVFLNLWASWCPPCIEEMPAIQQASLDHPDVLFIGVAVEDDPVAAEEFGASVGITYPLAAEESDRFLVDYQYRGLPASYLISADGQIVGRVFGGVDTDDLDGLVEQFLTG